MINLLKRLKRNPKKVIDYIVGNYRYFMYPIFIRKHIIDQYFDRIEKVTKNNPKCISNGECIECGCKTPNLFFSNRACEGGCYGPMLNKKEYNEK